MSKLPAYVSTSFIFLILIGIGFAYSYFFYPNEHPLDCALRSYTGKDCPSCGFSRSFSYYSHFQFSEGMTYNSASLPVFLFFVFQFLTRGAVLIYFFATRKIINTRLIKIDVIISISLFLLAFLPLIIKF